jgi:hypothetical protein
MLQVLATVLAEPPSGAGLASWRDGKSQVVRALLPDRDSWYDPAGSPDPS